MLAQGKSQREFDHWSSAAVGELGSKSLRVRVMLIAELLGHWVR